MGHIQGGTSNLDTQACLACMHASVQQSLIAPLPALQQQAVGAATAVLYCTHRVHCRQVAACCNQVGLDTGVCAQPVADQLVPPAVNRLEDGLGHLLLFCVFVGGRQQRWQTVDVMPVSTAMAASTG